MRCALVFHLELASVSHMSECRFMWRLADKGNTYCSPACYHADISTEIEDQGVVLNHCRQRRLLLRLGYCTSRASCSVTGETWRPKRATRGRRQRSGAIPTPSALAYTLFSPTKHCR